MTNGIIRSALAGILLAGCSREPEPTATIAATYKPTALSGRWEAVEPGGTNRVRFHFFNEGTVNIEKGGLETVAKYSVLDERHFKMDIPEEGAAVVEYAVKGDTLTLVIQNETVALVKVGKP